VLLLARDVRRRAAAEERLDEALAFRKAMEDSAGHGPARARPGWPHHLCESGVLPHGGFSAEELQQAAAPPYWPPERVAEYSVRQAQRLASPRPGIPTGGNGFRGSDARVGYETVFMRKNGERFRS